MKTPSTPRLDRLQELADRLRAELSPYCERLEVAGGVRRRKPVPHDIELVAVPRLQAHRIRVDMFTEREEAVNVLDYELSLWKEAGRLSDRPDVRGRPAWGERFKRTFVHDRGERIALDIFSVLPPASWGVIYAIRTGPADFSHLFVTPQMQGGALPFGMRVEGGALYKEGQVVETPEEEDFFHALDIPCWPPAMRTGPALTAWLRRKHARPRAERS